MGALFVIKDEASAVLERIAGLFADLDANILRTKELLGNFAAPGLSKTVDEIAGLNKSLTGLNTRLTGMDTRLTDLGGAANELVAGFGRAAAAADTSFTAIDTAAATSLDALRGLKVELGEIAAAGKLSGGGAGAVALAGAAGAAGAPPGRAPSTGAAGGGGHLGFGGSSVALPGGQAMHFGGTPALVGAGAVAYGAFEEAKVQDFVNKIFLTGGITTGTETTNPLFKTIHDAITKTYIMTGLPLEQIEEGILTGTRGLAGIDLTKRLALMPGLLSASATEAYLKSGTSVPEAMQAFVGLAHMEGKYQPEEIAKLAEHFAFLSTTTPVSVEQIERAAGYAIPMLRTANFDPEQLLLMITSMERAGIQNTKAGTWISQLATQSFPGTSLMSKMLFKKHEAALSELGLIDDHDKPTWFTNGVPDLVKMTSIAGDAIQKMDPAHRLAIEKALWGQQGGRAAGFFADPINRQIMGNVANEEPGFIAGEAMWKQSLANSPIVAFRTSMAGLNVELMNLGSNVLPYVTDMVKKANETIGGKGELALGAAGLLAWATKGAWGAPLGRAMWGLGEMALGTGIVLPATAAAGGYYAASQLSTPEAARHLMAQPDPGYETRKRIDAILNPSSAAIRVNPIEGAMDAAAAAARATRDAAGIRDAIGRERLNDLTPTGGQGKPYDPLSSIRAVSQVGIQIQGSIQSLPSVVEPAIHSAFASIGASISAAISSMAASARAAAGAIPPNGSTHVIENSMVLQVSGRKLAEVVSSEQIAANRWPNNSAFQDSSGSLAGVPDGQYA